MLGILPANLPIFALPVLNEPDVYTQLPPRWWEALAWGATRFFADQKFITLFSLLFGAGLFLQSRKCRERGLDFVAMLGRRMGALFVFGVLHAVLIWPGDVLTLYAPIGLLVGLAAGWPARRQAWVGAALIALPLVFLTCLLPVSAVSVGAGAVAPTVFAPPAAATGSLAGFLDGMFHIGPDFERAVYHDASFGRICVMRAATWMAIMLGGGWFYGWRIAGLFLVGMACMQDGAFSKPAAHRDRLRRWLTVGLTLGVPLEAAACWLHPFGEPALARAIGGEWCQYAGSLALALAYAAGAGLLAARAESLAGWLRPVAAIGRLAFSNYILQSVVCTGLFYSYGLGWYGELDRCQLWGVMLAVWTVQLGLSVWWLRRFQTGPLEAVWRTATWLRWPGLR